MELLNALVAWWPSPIPAQRRGFEAAIPSNYHPIRGDPASGDQEVNQSRDRLRNLARYLDDNHDIIVGVFDDLIDNIVGQGVQISPMVRLADGSLDQNTNRDLAELWEQWSEYPEASESFGLETMERMVARHWLRDGEVFYQMIGAAAFPYKTEIPFVLELVEGDMVPYDLVSDTPRITHGVERNRYGAPLAYHVLDVNPGDTLYFPAIGVGETRRIPATRMRHLKFVRRLNQARGIPIVHSVINRLRDIKDIEESERIACKVASSIALAVSKDQALYSVANTETKKREYTMQAGAIYDLLPGEKIDTVGQSRPNEKLVEFRQMMLRAVASGTMTRYSSISKDYGGTYSAQRQELVEAATGYRALFGYLRSRFYRPVWTRFVEQSRFSGLLGARGGTDLSTLFRAEFRPPALPWIDPAKEAKAYEILVDAKLESRAEIARQRGRDPRKIEEEIAAERESNVYGVDDASINPQGSDRDPPDDEDEDLEDEQGQDRSYA